MSKKYDFVFLYEIKTRELESICLISLELERRGYSVFFIEMWDQSFWRTFPVEAKVLVPFRLSDDEWFRFVDYHIKKCNKYVNLQWEQVFSNIDEKCKDGDGTIGVGALGLAKQAMHLCWGKNNYNFLKNNYGVNENKLRITGNVTLDFLRPEFKNYFKTRDQIIKKYGLPRNKRICLFISSFGMTDYPEKRFEKEGYDLLAVDSNLMKKISKESRLTILEWIKKILEERDDIIFVYRPHPSEIKNKSLFKNQFYGKSLFLISEESLKQWIIISDNIYTWWSTSVAEIYMAKKSCAILRPYKIPNDYDLAINNNSKFIESYEQFKNTIDENNEFPILKSKIESYYYIDEVTPSYIKICDVLEEVYKNDKYNYNGDHIPRTVRSIINFNIYMILKRIMIYTSFTRKLLRLLYPETKYPNRLIDLEDYLYTKDQRRRHHKSIVEIKKIKNNIKSIINFPYCGHNE